MVQTNNDIAIINFIKHAKFAFANTLKKKLLIFGISFLGAIGGATYVYYSDPVFNATVTFFTDSDKGGKLGGYASIASQFGIDLGMGNDGAFTGENLFALFRSKSMIKKTLLSKQDSLSPATLLENFIQIHELKNFKGKNSTVNLQKQNIFKIEDNLLRDSIIDVIIEDIQKNRLSIDKVDRKADMYFIAYSDKNQTFAKAFAENLLSTVVDYYSQYKTKKSTANVAIIKHQTDSVRERLFGGFTDVAELNDLNQNPAKQILRAPVNTKQAEMQINTVLYGELLKNLKLAELTLKKETPLVQIIDRPELPLKNKKKGRLFGAIVGAFVSSLISCILFIIYYFKQAKKQNKIISIA